MYKIATFYYKKTARAVEKSGRMVHTDNTYFTYIGTPLVLIGMLAIEDISFFLPKVTAYFALIAGSSKQGKALLASVG